MGRRARKLAQVRSRGTDQRAETGVLRGYLLLVVVVVVVGVLAGSWFKQPSRNELISRAETGAAYTEDELKYMKESKDPLLMFIAGLKYLYQGNFAEFDATYMKILFGNYHDFKSLPNITIELSQSLNNRDKPEEAIRSLKRGLEIIQEPSALNDLYGILNGLYAARGRLSDYEETIQECLTRLDGAEFFPYYCYFHKNTLEQYKGNIEESISIIKRLHEELCSLWINQAGEKCPAHFVPLSIDPRLGEAANIKNRHIHSNDALSKWNLKQYEKECSTQEYPYYIDPTGSVFMLVSTNHTKMTCHDEDKLATVFRIPNAKLSGSERIISVEDSDSCSIFIAGYPYQSHAALPKRGVEPQSILQESLSVPAKEYENVLFATHFEGNYFHITIEVLNRIMVTLHHPDLKDIPNLKILLASEKQFTTEYFDLLNITHMIEPYEPSKYYYNIKNLYTVTWRFNKQPAFGDYHVEDYYVPPPPLLRFTQKKLMDAAKQYVSFDKPRNVLLFLIRTRTRKILDFEPFRVFLEGLAQEYRLELVIYGETELSIPEQILLFSRAVVVMGPHGAGFTNIIHCQESTAIIEFPVVPRKLSVYSRFASIFNLAYYTIESQPVHYYGHIRNVSPNGMRDVANTFRMVLPPLGFPSTVGSAP